MSEAQEFDPVPGAVTELEPGIRRILAPNPSPMTQRGTNTYLVGEGDVAVIDPGPALPAHARAILEALAPGERVAAILVTHSHLDHSPLARLLAQATGAPVLAFGDSRAGRSPVMRHLARDGLSAGGEGVDTAFDPDETLADGARIDIGALAIEALWTPGHFGNHLCFGLGDAVFTGDHVMGWASSLVSPPDGDLGDFMASTARLASRADRIFYPGHGAPVDAPADRLRWLLDHRRGREAEILAHLAAGPRGIKALTRAIYTDIPGALIQAAERNVFAHLIDLHAKGRVAAEPRLAVNAMFHAT